MTPIDFEALAEPFPADEIEWRVGNRAKSGEKASLLCYLTSRAVQARLDEVVGPARWRDAYTPLLEGGKIIGFLCELAIEVEPGKWVSKVDAADVTDVEATKGGISSALKRAAVKWGIGRYLYGVDTRYYPILKGYGPDDAVYCPLADKSPGHIIRPTLPATALPKPKQSRGKKTAAIDTTPTAEDQALADQIAREREAQLAQLAANVKESSDLADQVLAARKAKEAAEAARVAKHHPSWADDRPGFCSLISKSGMNPEIGMEAIGRASKGVKPSAMDPIRRAKALGWLMSDAGRLAYDALVVEREMPRGDEASA